MRKILDKFKLFESEGKSFEEISENIYLNYSSIKDIDLIYKIKKEISKEFSCGLMQILLIGSSHTGFSKNFEKTEGKDYDFCIIDYQIFEKILLKVQTTKLYKNKDNFYKNLSKGKLHYHYVDNELKRELEDIFERIRLNLKISKQISICFYISERAFIKVIANFLEKQWLQSKTAGRTTIQPLEIIRGV
ncbi:hypothetical protein [Fusobacterium mortiferum]|uniref:hypothetical protein n=1 Tax=Fusobacterium mortiferum TaxID=850 RepID=UPI00158EA136|nr:hypothetical protein [Fusobacterium mortiferum]